VIRSPSRFSSTFISPPREQFSTCAAVEAAFGVNGVNARAGNGVEDFVADGGIKGIKSAVMVKQFSGFYASNPK
jgi:hypothetical protein